MMGNPTTFEDLEAWKQARAVTNSIYSLTRQRPLDRDFGLSGQITRAAVSIMSNLAEGFERRHVAEKLQFYNVAKGSSAEVRSLLYVIQENYLDQTSTAQALQSNLDHIGRLVNGLAKSTEQRRRIGIRGIVALCLAWLGS
jgi:four helix bundle protein